eukprot:TRINITY_DN5079_c0_g1_i1.p1 TRINITY_DN5079_c0_g1~~TRINITY_DN5079_c0_g1_i1.p1  ORF type:complete len:1362 (+),score=409.08 TRINITY_DN5079_c0_g1_i1:67-4152(+)
MTVAAVPPVNADIAATLLAAAPLALVVLDPDCFITELNHVAAELLGFSNRQEAIGVAFADTVEPDEDGEQALGVLAATLAQEIPVGTASIKLLQQKDDSVKKAVFQAVSSNLPKQAEGALGLIIVMQEVGELKELAYIGGVAATEGAMAAPTPVASPPPPAPVGEPPQISSQHCFQDGDNDAAVAMGLTVSTFDRANALVFASDLDGHMTNANACFLGVMEKGAEEFLQRSLVDVLSEDTSDAWREALSEVISGATSPLFEARFKCKKGTNILFGASPQLSADGKVIGLLCVGQILPEAQSMFGGKKEGEASKKTKGMVMHELRSPLHGIIGLTNTLSQDESPFQKPLKMIKCSAERLLDMVTNLMDYWNLVEESVSMNDRLDMTATLSEALLRCDRAMDKRGKPVKKEKVNIVQEIASGLPAVYGDQQCVTQMLYHLLINALKFTHAGEVKVAIQAGEKNSQESRDELEIIVQDTGIGIASGSLGRIFEPFQQEDNSESRKYDGLGLGLAITNEVVRMHGGNVVVKSLQQKGSTFNVSLPCNPSAGGGDKKGPKHRAFNVDQILKESRSARGAPLAWLGPPNELNLQVGEPVELRGPETSAPKVAQSPACTPAPAPAPAVAAPAAAPAAPAAPAAAPAPAAAAAASAAPAPAADTEKKRIATVENPLIMSVDDDYVNQEVMRHVLEPAGFKVVVCMNGFECVEYMQQEKSEQPNLILLDLMMPGMDGFDVLQLMRKTYGVEELPIIMVSAKNQVPSVIRGFELGCNDWIHKPFDRQELLARVRMHIQVQHAVSLVLTGAGGSAPAIKDGDAGSQSQVAAAGGASTGPAQDSPAAGLTPSFVVTDSAALYATISTATELEGNMATALATLFEGFEQLAVRFGACRTEVLGASYLAIAAANEEAGSTAEGTPTERMLKMAVEMEAQVALAAASLDAQRIGGTMTLANAPALKWRMAVHAHSGSPHAINGKHPRQYPMGTFFSETVRLAQGLSEGDVQGTVVLSVPARQRVTAACEGGLREQGWQLVRQDVACENGAEAYFVLSKGAFVSRGNGSVVSLFKGLPPATLTGTSAAAGLGAVGADAGQQHVALLQQQQQQLEEALQGTQRALSQKQAQLMAAKSELQALQTQAEQRLASARGELQRLQMESCAGGGGLADHRKPTFQSANSFAAAVPQPTQLNLNGDSANTSLLFLQYQNHHLQVELRHCTQHLATTRSELQAQMQHVKMLEKKQMQLLEKVEHLEMDLGLRSCGVAGLAGLGGLGLGGGFSTPAGMSTLASGLASGAAFGRFGAGASGDPLGGLGLGSSSLMSGMPTLGSGLMTGLDGDDMANGFVHSSSMGVGLSGGLGQGLRGVANLGSIMP